MSAARPFKMPNASAGGADEGTHADLMRQIGSKDGFDPMPPSQHAYFLDRSLPEKIRMIAWVWSKTIRPGRGRRRSPVCKDERGFLLRANANQDLGIENSNASSKWRELVEEKRIRIDDKGHIWLRGDVPAPSMNLLDAIKAEDGRSEGENEENSICTDNSKNCLDPALLLYLQSLPRLDAEKVAGLYQQVEDWEKKAHADSVAAVREQAAQMRQQLNQAIAYTPAESKRGRPKIEREPVVQISLLKAPELSVQISTPELSVQKDQSYSVQPEMASVRISASLLNREQRESATEKLSPPPPSRAPEPAGRETPGERKPASEQTLSGEDEPEGLNGLLIAATSASLEHTRPQRPRIAALWRNLTPPERIAAIEGIRLRFEAGQYGPENLRYTPSLLQYLDEHKWEGVVRARKPDRAGADLSYLERLAAGEEA